MPVRYYAVTKLGGYGMPFEYSERHGFIPSCGNAQAPSSRPTAAEGQDTEAGGPDRRELLQRLLAAAFAVLSDWRHTAIAATLPLEPQRFVELSQKLCAMSIKDETLAGVIHKALANLYTEDELRRIAELLDSAPSHNMNRLIASSGFEPLAKALVSAWYSGSLGSGESARVLAYEDALAWRATGYAKAPGTCGEFGDWTGPPPNTSDREPQP